MPPAPELQPAQTTLTATPTIALQCIADNRFGCSDTQDNCCSDYMCFASGGGKACK